MNGLSWERREGGSVSSSRCQGGFREVSPEPSLKGWFADTGGGGGREAQALDLLRVSTTGSGPTLETRAMESPRQQNPQ